MLIPVPPLAEQKRIVTQLDEFMAICDRLEALLEAGRTAQAALLEATLREALNDEMHGEVRNNTEFDSRAVV